MNTSAIALLNLKKRFGNVVALDSVSLEIAAGEFFSLLGPSGCGKTTLLRLVAGFEQPDTGMIHIAGKDMTGVPPQRRPVNTVFQSYALFPHLTVFENVAFGLRVQKIREIEERVGEAMEMLRVTELRNRLPAEISGGQRQRVALARALVIRPKVLLLDEPLAAVDAQRRAQVQAELKELQRKSQTAFLYVTHDQDEALALSDRIAVMNEGCIQQIGTPREIYERPRNRFVASFLGRCNLIRGTIVRREGKLAEARTAFGILKFVHDGECNGAVTLGIRAERVQIGRDVSENQCTATITDVSYEGALTGYSLRVNGEELRALCAEMITGEVRACLPREALFVVEER